MMDDFLSWEEKIERCREWPIQDFLKNMLGAGDTAWKRNEDTRFTVFWDTTKTNQPESEFLPLEDTPPPAGRLPQSIQDRIKSLLLDTDLLGFRILVQFWAPIRTASGQRMLTASHQPFGIGQCLYDGLCTFRYSCTEHQYSVSAEDPTLLGPPGRVFIQRSPEFCPDVKFYSHEEFPLRKQALYCGIRYCAAIPLFERDERCCVGVLEFLSLSDFPIYFRTTSIIPELPPFENYDLEYQVHKCKWDRTCPSFTFGTREVMRSLAKFVKKKHELSLVQVWVACSCDIAPEVASSGEYADNSCSSSDPASRITGLFTHFISSAVHTMNYVARFGPFWVRNDRSLVERAYSQKKACFVQDISQFSIFDYPLVHVIRPTGLKACFAIPLHLVHPEFGPFILEIFLRFQQYCDGNLEDILQTLLFTVKERCSTDQVQAEKFSVQLSHTDYDNVTYLDVYQNGSSDANARSSDHHNATEGEAKTSCSREVGVSPNAAEAAITLHYIKQHFGANLDDAAEKLRGDRIQKNSSDATAGSNDHPNATEDEAKTSCSREVGVSPNAAQPEITLEVIKQYFGWKLNDAAEKLEVSRTTLKRRCREHGIKKWPSYKRKNVHGIQSSPRCPTRFVEGDAEIIQESEIEPPCPNNNQTERDAAASDGIPENAKGKSIAAQDEMDLDDSYTVIVKATYKDDTVKFPLRSNSKIEELRRELDERFEFKAERFKIKYEDEGDWILMSCDKDLRFRMDDLKSSGQTRMNVSIFPATL